MKGCPNCGTPNRSGTLCRKCQRVSDSGGDWKDAMGGDLIWCAYLVAWPLIRFRHWLR